MKDPSRQPMPDTSTRVALVRATAHATDFLFRHAFPLYVTLYDAYKRVTEHEDIDLIHRLVKRGDSVVDVGANIGFYSEVLANCVGADGHVYAFEPEQRNFDRLVERARPYPQIHPVRAAVADKPGPIDLYLSPHLNIDHRTYPTEERRQRTTIEAVSLDSFLADRADRIQFIKMDIQGAEYAALLGMRDVVQRSPHVRILMELWPFVHERFGAGTMVVLSLLESWGFETHRLGKNGHHRKLSPNEPLPGRNDPKVYFDVLCIRRGTSFG